MEEFRILGVKTTPATIDELHRALTELVEEGGPGFCLSANIHGLNLARKTPWLREFYNRAQLVRVDGAGVVLGAKLLGREIPPRLTWADWGWLLAEYLAGAGHTVFFLGGARGAAEEAGQRLKAHAPGLRLVGVRHGFFRKTGPENEAVIEAINRAEPDVLVIGMGMPLQERWLLDNHRRLKVKVYLTGGNAFHYLAGWTKRCPEWMGRMGLEWLYRLLQEPRRMFKRYIWGNTVFILAVLRQKWGLIRLPEQGSEEGK